MMKAERLNSDFSVGLRNRKRLTTVRDRLGSPLSTHESQPAGGARSLNTNHYPLPTTHYPLPTTHYPLPTTHQPPTTNH